MAKTSTQQEILILTGTSFSSRQFIEKDSSSKKNNFTEREQLEEACWSGLLPDLLPEICKQPDAEHKIYLWQIKEADAFIELELSEFPEKTDSYFSIDPYNFMKEKNYN
ncbi:MAG TPA: hypothetical protein VKT28_07290 [Puia sp.]|nr:hypothetical protein [Puia sp.]